MNVHNEYLIKLLEDKTRPNQNELNGSAIFDIIKEMMLGFLAIGENILSEKLTVETIQNEIKYQESYYSSIIKYLDHEFFNDPIKTEKICWTYLNYIDSRLNHLTIDINNRNQKCFNKYEYFDLYIYGTILLIRNRILFYSPSYSIHKSNIPKFLSDKYDLTEKNEILLDKRISSNAPTNRQKIKALKSFCPELINKLSKQDINTQKQIIHLITGANLVDSYKYSFGSRQNLSNNVKIENLIELVNKINS